MQTDPFCNMSLEVLRKGLAIVKDHVKRQKDDLIQWFKKNETIPDTDVAWLDEEANHVEEDALIDSS